MPQLPLLSPTTHNTVLGSAWHLLRRSCQVAGSTTEPGTFLGAPTLSQLVLKTTWLQAAAHPYATGHTAIPPAPLPLGWGRSGWVACWHQCSMHSLLQSYKINNGRAPWAGAPAQGGKTPCGTKAFVWQTNLHRNIHPRTGGNLGAAFVSGKCSGAATAANINMWYVVQVESL